LVVATYKGLYILREQFVIAVRDLSILGARANN